MLRACAVWTTTMPNHTLEPAQESAWSAPFHSQIQLECPSNTRIGTARFCPFLPFAAESREAPEAIKRYFLYLLPLLDIHYCTGRTVVPTHPSSGHTAPCIVLS